MPELPLLIDAHEEPQSRRPAGRRTGVGVNGAFVALLLLGGATACSSADPPAPLTASGPVTSSAGEESVPPDQETTTTAAVPEDDAESTVLPEALVGAWESKADGGTATIAYRFTADGRYKYVGLLFYPNTDGDDIQITFIAEGTARVEGDDLVTTPTTATRSRKDPGDPAGDYTAQPSNLTPERHQWEVADHVLALTDGKGAQVLYERQSQ